jgi:hypothetical protein
MDRTRKKFSPIAYVSILLFALIFTACNGNPSVDFVDEESSEMEEMSDTHEHEEGDHPPRVPNEGRIIRIISPESMSSFAASEQILVEIETENFELGDGNHWHVYIDGASWGMVTGNNTDQPLVGLEPGEHEIAVFLSIESHEELEDGDDIMVTITE